MTIYGVALLAISFLLGQWMGSLLGDWLGIQANVGGVGFAMIFLMLGKEWLVQKKQMTSEMTGGIAFWSKMYIPVVIAMAASLNVKSAVSSGSLALVAGIIPVLASFLAFPWIMKKFNPKHHG
ncbi:malonate transporter subunit MadL [Algoriphagus kandeliae]|uniref:Malonate transporter subunit MadL n=1 Tax=Algoriphagus kandeliae TaxID=2562278 RepID=A0A4Y9QUA1_9BACT|nr:malonate transporter subunit MadL [Algoriphagus kandeliae]TFV94535.1 malonate transporter subunit MadL [Algoriphagus kandeliae]